MQDQQHSLYSRLEQWYEAGHQLAVVRRADGWLYRSSLVPSGAHLHGDSLSQGLQVLFP
jgi:hypothetical protein